VAHLANLLRQPAGAAEEVSLVPIRRQGAGTALFCVHPAGGTVLCYLELARHLEADVPIYGLQAQGIEGELEPLESVFEMAACYLRAIKTVQPDGPYHLCGWSTGGIIAFEVARQLAAQGDEIALVALLDAAIPRTGENFSEADVGYLLGMLFPGEDLTALQASSGDEQLDAFRSRAQRASLLATGATTAQARRIYSVFQANMKAVVEYQPGSFDQRLTLIKAAQHVTPMHADPQLGWGQWAMGGFEIHDVACSHLAMLQQPAVQQVAQALDACLIAQSREMSTAVS
jgi:thioesterase domain-containing protein